jgi:hypothetical protein
MRSRRESWSMMSRNGVSGPCEKVGTQMARPGSKSEPNTTDLSCMNIAQG